MIPKKLTWSERAYGLTSNQANRVIVGFQNEERAEGEKAKPSVVTLKRQSQVGKFLSKSREALLSIYSSRWGASFINLSLGERHRLSIYHRWKADPELISAGLEILWQPLCRGALWQNFKIQILGVHLPMLFLPRLNRVRWTFRTWLGLVMVDVLTAEVL